MWRKSVKYVKDKSADLNEKRKEHIKNVEKNAHDLEKLRKSQQSNRDMFKQQQQERKNKLKHQQKQQLDHFRNTQRNEIDKQTGINSKTSGISNLALMAGLTGVGKYIKHKKDVAEKHAEQAKSIAAGRIRKIAEEKAAAAKAAIEETKSKLAEKTGNSSNVDKKDLVEKVAKHVPGFMEKYGHALGGAGAATAAIGAGLAVRKYLKYKPKKQYNW